MVLTRLIQNNRYKYALIDDNLISIVCFTLLFQGDSGPDSSKNHAITEKEVIFVLSANMGLGKRVQMAVTFLYMHVA